MIKNIGKEFGTKSNLNSSLPPYSESTFILPKSDCVAEREIPSQYLKSFCFQTDLAMILITSELRKSILLISHCVLKPVGIICCTQEILRLHLEDSSTSENLKYLISIFYYINSTHIFTV